MADTDDTAFANGAPDDGSVPAFDVDQKRQQAQQAQGAFDTMRGQRAFIGAVSQSFAKQLDAVRRQQPAPGQPTLPPPI